MKELTLLFLVKEDKVLLAMKKRGFGVGRWNGVGGKLEPGETIEEALVRECQEEINVTPFDCEQMALLNFEEFVEGEKRQMAVHVFVANAWEGEPEESEEMRPEWFPVQDLPLDTMWPDDEFWLPQVLEGKRIRATFTLDDQDVITDKTVQEVDKL